MKIDALSLSLKASVTVIAKHLPETGCPECLSLSWGNAKSNRWTIMVSIRRLKCPRHMTSSLKKMAFSKPLRYGPPIRKVEVSEWRGKKGEIRGVVFNEKNYKDEPGLNLLWAIRSTIRLQKSSETWWGSTHPTEHYRRQQILVRSCWQIKKY